MDEQSLMQLVKSLPEVLAIKGLTLKEYFPEPIRVFPLEPIKADATYKPAFVTTTLAVVDPRPALTFI